MITGASAAVSDVCRAAVRRAGAAIGGATAQPTTRDARALRFSDATPPSIGARKRAAAAVSRRAERPSSATSSTPDARQDRSRSTAARPTGNRRSGSSTPGRRRAGAIGGRGAAHPQAILAFRSRTSPESLREIFGDAELFRRAPSNQSRDDTSRRTGRRCVDDCADRSPGAGRPASSAASARANASSAIAASMRPHSNFSSRISSVTASRCAAALGESLMTAFSGVGCGALNF